MSTSWPTSLSLTPIASSAFLVPSSSSSSPPAPAPGQQARRTRVGADGPDPNPGPGRRGQDPDLSSSSAADRESPLLLRPSPSPPASEPEQEQEEPTLSTHLFDLALDRLADFPLGQAAWRRLADRPGARTRSSSSSSSGLPARGMGRSNPNNNNKVESFRSEDGWAGRRSVHSSSELSWEQAVEYVYHRHFETEIRFVPSLEAVVRLDDEGVDPGQGGRRPLAPLGPLPSRLVLPPQQQRPRPPPTSTSSLSPQPLPLQGSPPPSLNNPLTPSPSSTAAAAGTTTTTAATATAAKEEAEEAKVTIDCSSPPSSPSQQQQQQQQQQQKAGLFKLHYAMPFPLRPRTFLVCLLQTVDLARGELLNVTLPLALADDPPPPAVVGVGVDRPGEKGGEKGRVRGRYVAVERIRRIEDGTRIEWSMMTLSDPAGVIPSSLARRAVPKEIAKDVAGLIDLLAAEAGGGDDAHSRG